MWQHTAIGRRAQSCTSSSCATPSRVKKTGHAAEQEREDIKAAREAFFASQDEFQPAKLFFVDETGTSTKMARAYGRAPRGERCRAAIPHGHWQTTTLVGALTLAGIEAPMTLPAAMNGAAFATWATECLAPVLSPGDVVIMDNLPAHKTADARRAIQAAGANVVYLPPYSPDFNPIELAFSKIKALLKRAATRTVEDLWNAIRDAIDAITPADANAFFKACGYDPE